MKGIPNMGNLMKQAQQFQSKMTKLQEELEDKTIESSSGGGMVTVVVNGRQELLSIKIDPEVVDPDDTEMLQDLILAAVNDGLAKAKNMVNDEMKKLTQDSIFQISQAFYKERGQWVSIHPPLKN